MEFSEIVTAALALWTSVLTVVQILQARKQFKQAAETKQLNDKNDLLNKELAEVQHSLEKAKIEQGFERQLTEARRHFEQIVVSLAQLTGDDQEQNKAALEKTRKSALEDYVNAVNSGCEKYLSNRLDRTAFEDMYKDAFLKLAEDEEIAVMVNSLTSKHRHFRNVLIEWRKLSRDQ